MPGAPFKVHQMYKGDKSVTADTHSEHLALGEKGYGHDKTGPPFKGANAKNSSCYDGFKKCGTKKSPSGAGNGPVNNCIPEGEKCK